MDHKALDLFEFESGKLVLKFGVSLLNINDSNGWILDKLWTCLGTTMELGLCYKVGCSM